MMATERISKERAGCRDGERIPCRWCGKMPTGARRTFCSAECVHEHKLRTSPAYQAHCVLKRDHGVCEMCGRDCLAELKNLMAERRARAAAIVRASGHNYECWRTGEYGFCDHEDCASLAIPHHSKELRTACHPYCESVGLPFHLRDGDRRLWEMDHRVPVVEGGGDCGLENLRTLCCDCHHRVTAELAARRAEERRRAKRERDPQQQIPGVGR